MMIGLLFCATVASSCGSQERVGRAGATECGGEPGPISTEDLVAALREHGFTASRSQAEPLCDPKLTREEDVLAEVGNGDAGDYENIRATEGRVDCSVFRGPIYGDELIAETGAAPDSPAFSGPKGLFSYRNVQCVIYAGGDDRYQVATLERAFEALAG